MQDYKSLCAVITVYATIVDLNRILDSNHCDFENEVRLEANMSVDAFA